MSYGTLTVETADRITRITLNMPDRLNAANGEMHRELSEAFAEVGRSPDSDVVVLTGAGKAFCAGGDLEWIESMIAQPGKFETILEEAKAIVIGALGMPKPMIGRLNGDAIGLGATLALCCDMLVATDSARFGDPHVRVGLVAGDGASVMLPQMIGYMKARELLLLGGVIDAAEAYRIGLYNHVVAADELDPKVDDMADKLARGATRAIRYTKLAVNKELVKLATEKMDMLMAYEALSANHPHHAEAIRAMREKRRPDFGGAA
ncbi:MAG: enoyl-CoA hydratase [Hoeflea sp.]|uniref:enoyl-CoA hydratase/isomerase family protein n=1 Tax=Hoeflea sp. TaxID=1940281 RepID=UPI000C0D52F6|nr:enoyl-CoA hydratase-related protein [Hoeflea sp.]PHR20680.1 MAG: enoyl-CoA hydratase [Hoeflea sp.]